MTYEERVLRHKYPDEKIEVGGLAVRLCPLSGYTDGAMFTVTRNTGSHLLDCDAGSGSWGEMVSLAIAILESENTRAHFPEIWKRYGRVDRV